jgi:hypothetical protein
MNKLINVFSNILGRERKKNPHKLLWSQSKFGNTIDMSTSYHSAFVNGPEFFVKTNINKEKYTMWKEEARQINNILTLRGFGV